MLYHLYQITTPEMQVIKKWILLTGKSSLETEINSEWKMCDKRKTRNEREMNEGILFDFIRNENYIEQTGDIN